MSQAREWQKLNNVPESSFYIELPLAFTGKGTPAFADLSFSAQYVLACIHTFNKINGKPAKLTYEHFINLYGMSKETVSACLKTLTVRGILERVKQSHYRIIPKYNKKDYTKLDEYLLKREFDVAGVKKRLARSRLINLSLLIRGASNPKTCGEFVSSQGRIAKALNIPRTTAGDSLRELYAVGLISYTKQNGNGKQKRGCSIFNVHPQILAVKHAYLDKSYVQAIFAPVTPNEASADELHKRLMLDDEYKNIYNRLKNKKGEWLDVLRKYSFDEAEQFKRIAIVENDIKVIGSELARYFKAYNIDMRVFPPNYYDENIQFNTAI